MPSTRRFFLHITPGLGIVLWGGAQAQSDSSPRPPGAPASQSANADLAEGEVRRIDREAGKLTLRHGEIRHLDMPAMTMVFQVKDPGLLGLLKVGDKIRFRAEKQGGAYVVTAVDALK